MRFTEFSELCEAQGATLHTAIEDRTRSLGFPCAAYEGLDAEISNAGALLRTNPNLVLATGSQPIELPAMADLSTFTLTAIINATLPGGHISIPGRDFISSPGGVLDCCQESEQRFAATFRELENFPKRAPCDIILDDDEQPLLIRKGGIPTALSLGRLVINHIPYPAGSLFRVDTPHDASYDEMGNMRHHNPIVGTHGLRVLGKEEVLRIGFLRISAYAYEPEIRERAKPRFYDSADPKRRIAISEISKLAEKAIAPN